MQMLRKQKNDEHVAVSARVLSALRGHVAVSARALSALREPNVRCQLHCCVLQGFIVRQILVFDYLYMFVTHMYKLYQKK
jgi:hypothetical protein